MRRKEILSIAIMAIAVLMLATLVVVTMPIWLMVFLARPTLATPLQQFVARKMMRQMIRGGVRANVG